MNKQSIQTSFECLPADSDFEFSDDVLQNIGHASNKYEEYRNQVKARLLGKTAQLWLTYMDMIKMQHALHTAVQENNFNLGLFSWEYFLPFYFALNKTNYARYGSYYVAELKAMDTRFPDLKEILKSKGLSIQAQGKYPLRTAVDQRGEQTINRDAKTAGGIKAFGTNTDSVAKWCLNRAEQAKNKKILENLCGLDKEGESYKPTRPSQIRRSEKLVESVIEVLTEDYINPFQADVEKDKIVCLSSGVPVSQEIADSLLSLENNGKNQYKDFVNKRILTKEIAIHNPIKRNPIKNFNTSRRKTVLKGGKKTIEVNRNILAKLFSISLKQDEKIDFQKALVFPLSEVPLSLCNPDGSMKKTNKSKLSTQILALKNESPQIQPTKSTAAVVVDLIALIRSMVQIPTTFEELAMDILSLIPKEYTRVDLVADSYLPHSIKYAERSIRGEEDSSKILIKSIKSKIPRDFSTFLSNGSNKTRMVELIFEFFKSIKGKALNILRTTVLILSREGACTKVTLSSCEPFPELLSNQEEADTKVIAHSFHILQQPEYKQVVIRSPSGDTDILVLAVSLLNNDKKNVFIDNGSGVSRTLHWLGSLEISEQRCRALIGLHAFTGNDYVSSFFRKGKDRCWKLVEKYDKFEECFLNLGSMIHLTEAILLQLEEFVCYLYGVKIKLVNDARWNLFDRKYKRENKVPDLSSLPPSRQSLYYHCKRSNLVAYIWRNSQHPLFDIPDISDHGWFADGQIQWIDEAFPEEIEDLLCNHADKFNEEDENMEENYEFYGSEIESEDEFDEF